MMAPIIGWMNLKAVTGNDMPQANKPKTGLRVLTYLGMIFLSLFAVYYCWMVFV